MKKGTTIALIIAAIMIIVGATLVNLARGRGEDVKSFFNGGAAFSFNGGAIHIGDNQKNYTVCPDGEESFDAAEVKSLNVDWISGSMSVEPYDGKTVVIREKADKPLTEGQCMRWQLSGGELHILFCANGETAVPDKSLTVLLPRGLILRSADADAVSAPVSLRGLSVSGMIDVDTTSGAILVSACAGRELNLDAVSGAVTVEESAVTGTVGIDTTSGAITLRAIACADLDVDTISGVIAGEAVAVGRDADVDSGSGRLALRELSVSGDVDVDTGSGAVELRFSGQPASVDVETASGAVMLAFPKGTVIDLDFDTASGRLSGTVNSAPKGVPVQVDTVSGDLTIEED